MNKNEVLKVVKAIAKEHEFDCTLEDCNELIKIFTDVYTAVGEKLEVGQSANVGAVKVVKKEVAAKEGVSKLGEKEVHWKTNPKIKIDLKAKTSFIKENEKEI